MGVGGGILGFRGGGGSGGAFYKSLTGPGETVTPGALTQLGSFTIIGPTFKVTAATGITLKANKNVQITSSTTTLIFHVKTGKKITVRLGTNTLVIKKTGTSVRLTSTQTIRIVSARTGTSLILSGRGTVSLHSNTGTVRMTAFDNVIIKGRLGTVIYVNTAPTTGISFTHQTTATCISTRTHLLLKTAGTTTGNSIRFLTGHMGFFTKAPIAKPSAGATLTTLRTALQNLGLVS